ncbi:hypothetical protein ABK040_000146 [Willaertia magna]
MFFADSLIHLSHEDAEETQHLLVNNSDKSKLKKKSTTDVIHQNKRQFIRRTMIMLCFSDFMFSSCNILFTVWVWCSTYIPDFNPSEGKFKEISWIIQHTFAQGNYSFCLCSATWSVFIAIAIYTTIKRVNWIETNKKYDIIFHIIAWSVAIVTFLFLFVYGMTTYLTGFRENNPGVDKYIAFSCYLFGALYLTMAGVVNLCILIIIWRYVGNVLSATQIRIVPKEETKRARYNIVRKLSLYLLPFLISGSCQAIWFYYLGFSTLLNRTSPNFEFVFYTFFFSVFAPLQGFLNCCVYGFGLPSVRNSLLALLTCQYCRKANDKFTQLSMNNTLDNNDDIKFGRLSYRKEIDTFGYHNKLAFGEDDEAQKEYSSKQQDCKL